MRVLLLIAAFLLSSSALAQDASTTTSGPQPAPAAPGSGSASAAPTAAPATATIDAPVALAPVPAVTTLTLAPIASAAPGSSTFQLVKKTICSDALVKELNAIYVKNRAMFDECAAEADFQIFPNSGKKPTAKQIRAMAVAKSCAAIFTAIVRADFPACDMGGLPLKSVTETLLKVKVDIDEGKESPSAQRFNEMMKWRRDVNLAQEAGVPYDSDSALFREFKVNLWKARASPEVRVSSDFTVEYQLANGTYTRGALALSSLGDGSSDSTVGKVKAAAIGSDSGSGSPGASSVGSVGSSSASSRTGCATGSLAVALIVTLLSSLL